MNNNSAQALGNDDMPKSQSLQEPYLNALRKERIPVSIFLVNGIKLQGQIDSFDQYVIVLRNTVNQMVYKHAVSTVVPVRNPSFSEDDSDSDTVASTKSQSFGKLQSRSSRFGNDFSSYEDKF